MKFRHLKTKGHSATRAKLGLSQRQLAEQLGISKAALSMAETGRRDLPAAALLKLRELEKKLAAAMETTTEESHIQLTAEATIEFNKLRKEQCDAQIKQLTIKLETMEERYKKLNTQLRLLDTIVEKESGKPDKALVLSLQSQRLNIVSKISKCNAQEQARLRNKIAVLNAEVNMQ
jgi:transcriptional regulator with XRE-family HTH domain